MYAIRRTQIAGRILNRGVNRPQHAGQKKKSDRKIRNCLYKNQAFQPVNIRIRPAEKIVSNQTAAAKKHDNG